MATYTGSNPIGIGIGIYLRDYFSSTARTVTNNLNNLSQTSLRVMQDNMRNARDLGLAGGAIGAGLMAGMKNWFEVSADFKYEMAMVKNIATGTADQISMLEPKARELGRRTMFTSQEVASGMKFMAMAGMSANDMMKNIEAAVSLAGALQYPLGGKLGSADIMTNIMAQFQIEATKSMQVADMLVETTIASNTNLYDLAEAIKYTGTTAHMLGLGLDTVAASVGVLGNLGIQGSMAGTALENMLRYITRAISESRTGRQGDALKNLGLHPDDLMDARGELLQMPLLIRRIQKAIVERNASGLMDTQAFQDIFGVRGNRAAGALMRNPDMFDSLYDRIVNSYGKSSSLLKKMMEEDKGNIMIMTSAWEEFKISFGEAISPIVVPLLKGLTMVINALSALSKTTVGKGLLMIAGILIAISTAALGLSGIIAGFGLIFLRARGSFTSLVSGVMTGWQLMTSAASRYGLTMRAALTGMPFGMNPHMWHGAGVKRAANGRLYTTNTATGAAQFLSKKQAAAMGASAAPGGSLMRMLLAKLGMAGAASMVPGVGSVITLGLLIWTGIDLLSMALGDNTEAVENATQTNEEAQGSFKDYIDNRMEIIDRMRMDTEHNYRTYDTQMGIFDNMLRTLVQIRDKETKIDIPRGGFNPQMAEPLVVRDSSRRVLNKYGM